VRSRDAAVAAKTANRLSELFIEGNLQVRAGQVARTRDVIAQQLAQMRGELGKSEAKIAAFKRANASTLPELNEARMRERDQLAKQIEVETGFIQTAQQRIDLIGVLPAGRETEVGRMEQQVDDLRAKLGTARAALTPEHPDVQALSRELGNAQARLEQAKDAAAEGRKICVETIEELSLIPGVAGVHIMAPGNVAAIPEVLAAVRRTVPAAAKPK